MSAFAAGLSLGFLSDAQLVGLPFETLRSFKEKHRDLLHRHQLHLLDVAQRFRELPEDPGFEHALLTLRAEAEKRRLELETEAHTAWRTAGIDVARNAIVAGSTALVTGLAVLRGSSWAELLSVGIPAMAAGVGTAAASTLDAAAKLRGLRVHGMAYLFESAKLAETRLSVSNR